jgi:nucleotide-binding universal stress UspA family protein
MINMSRIVCPTDFSPTSSRAVDYAATMAKNMGAELILVHVIPTMDYPLRSFGISSSIQHIEEEIQARAKESLEQRAAKLKESISDISTRLIVLNGEAHEATLECAESEKADLIVIGTHGHTGITHALLGSTAEKVVRLSKCPVLTVGNPDK